MERLQIPLSSRSFFAQPSQPIRRFGGSVFGECSLRRDDFRVQGVQSGLLLGELILQDATPIRISCLLCGGIDPQGGIA
jgi:hypothetical protein